MHAITDPADRSGWRTRGALRTLGRAPCARSCGRERHDDLDARADARGSRRERANQDLCYLEWAPRRQRTIGPGARRGRYCRLGGTDTGDRGRIRKWQVHLSSRSHRSDNRRCRRGPPGAFDIAALPIEKRSRELRQRLQMVFQNPDSTLNPSHSVGFALARTLRRLRGLDRRAARAEARRLLETVQLPAAYAERRPQQLSGGEKQRVAIARAPPRPPTVSWPTSPCQRSTSRFRRPS